MRIVRALASASLCLALSSACDDSRPSEQSDKGAEAPSRAKSPSNAEFTL